MRGVAFTDYHCGVRHSSYIGETGRQFNTRLQEHLSAYLKNEPNKSAFAEHLFESDDDPSKVSSEILLNWNLLCVVNYLNT